MVSEKKKFPLLIIVIVKRTKYSNIHSDLNINFTGYDVCQFTCELRSLGFISDLCEFTAKLSINVAPDFVYRQSVRSVIGNSYYFLSQ